MKNKAVKVFYLLTIMLLIFIIYNKYFISIENKEFSTKPNKKSEVKDYSNYLEDKKLNSKMKECPKVVYLTFDDGPSFQITNNILDTLKEYNIKATFFIIGKEIYKKENILRRIYNEKHAIGLHTFSHNFKKVYSSNDKFIEEMKATQDLIYQTIGYRTNIIRFPGGSHHRIDDDLRKKLINNNFKVYDWTHNAGDGISYKQSSNKLLCNSKKKIISKKSSPGVIILMHCTYNNKNTCKALPKIIDYYKKEGYVFDTINEDTPEYISE